MSLAAAVAAVALLHGDARSQSSEFFPSADVRAAPSDWNLAAPDPEPALPAEFDAFDPPLLATAMGPVIAEASRTAGPGESFVVSGVGLGPSPRFRTYSRQGIGGDAQVSWSSDAAAAAALPPAPDGWATYVVWPESAEGRGRPFFLNRTDAWWAGPLPAAPGGQAAVYGRNLSRGNGTEQAWIYIQPKRGGAVQASDATAARWAKVTGVSPYKVEFLVPQDLGPGDHEIWAHNSHGGRFGWSGPVELVVAASPWSGQEARVLNVRRFGARGDGVADDTASIEAALAEAQRNAPATVYFPAGRYIVSHGLRPPARVRWLGAGRDATAIVARPGLRPDKDDQRTYALLFAEGPANGIEVSQLTLDNSASQGLFGSAVHIRFARDIAFRDVRIRSHPGDYFQFDGTRGLLLQRLELIGTGGFLGTASQVFIEDCDFLLTNNANSAITSWGGHEVSIVGNRARDLDGTRREETGAGRFFVSQSHFGSLRHVYIADNVTTDLGPPTSGWTEFDQNSGEHILLEQCCSRLTADVAVASRTTVTPASDTFDPSLVGRFDVLVVAGRGLGQHRRIVAYDPGRREMTIASPWLVVPDASSKIVVTGLAEQVVIYRNRLDGKANYADASTALSGVRLYANTVDVVVAANRFTRFRGGVELWAIGVSPLPDISSIFFNLITDNLVADSYDAFSVQSMYLYTEAPGAVGLFGNVFRRNQSERLAGDGVRFVRWSRPQTGAMIANVFELNEFKDVAVGVSTSASALATAALTPLVGTVLRGNLFKRGAAPYAGSVEASWPPGVPLWGDGNSWQGFESAGGTPP